jgi:hypothetical protein
MMKADEVLANAPGKAFIADARHDSNRFRQTIRDRKKRAVVGFKPERPRKLPKCRALYSKRHLVERAPGSRGRRCFFHNLKRFRALAARFEKAARSFLARPQVASCGHGWRQTRNTSKRPARGANLDAAWHHPSRSAAPHHFVSTAAPPRATDPSLRFPQGLDAPGVLASSRPGCVATAHG